MYYDKNLSIQRNNVKKTQSLYRSHLVSSDNNWEYLEPERSFKKICVNIIAKKAISTALYFNKLFLAKGEKKMKKHQMDKI